MLYGAQTGESSVLSPFKTALNNNDIVEVIITGMGMPHKYLQSIEDKNIKAKEEEALTAIPGEVYHPTYKEGGMTMEIAVLYKISEDGLETDFRDEFETEKGIYHSINMPTPLQFFERGFDVKDQRRGGKILQGPKDKPYIGMFSKDDYPLIDDIYPSPQELKVWDNGVIVKDASAITDDDLDDLDNGKEYEKILQRENKRIEGIEKMKKLWDNWTEAECKNFLILALSSRFLLHDKERKKGAQYHLPRVGMRFTAKVQRKTDKEGKLSKYINFLSFGDWDRENQCWNYYSEGTVPPTEDDKALAEDIRSKQIICFSS